MLNNTYPVELARLINTEYISNTHSTRTEFPLQSGTETYPSWSCCGTLTRRGIWQTRYEEGIGYLATTYCGGRKLSECKRGYQGGSNRTATRGVRCRWHIGLLGRGLKTATLWR